MSKRNTQLLGQNSIFTPEVMDDIHIKSQLGRYRMRGMALMKKIPHWDDLVFLPGTLTRFVIEGYRECQLPWDKKVARVFVTCFRNREERQNPGGHLTSDCRGNLRIFMDEFQKKHGLELRVGTEPEMMWLTKNPDGTPTGKGFSKPYCYHIDQFESLRPVYMKVIDYCRAMGLDVIQGDHEDAPGQLELNFMYDDVLRNADRLTTYRQICAQVAK